MLASRVSHEDNRLDRVKEPQAEAMPPHDALWLQDHICEGYEASHEHQNLVGESPYMLRTPRYNPLAQGSPPALTTAVRDGAQESLLFSLAVTYILGGR